jgi:predicted ATPase
MTQILKTITPIFEPSQPKPKALTETGVGGFKSFTNFTKIKLGALSILAGTNSSGKSSIMQPLLLIKQTIEAPYDPGVLLLDGPNIRFTSSEQFISKILTSHDSKEFQVFIANDQLDFQSRFQWSAELGISIYSQKFSLKKVASNTDNEIELFSDIETYKNLKIYRERCFLLTQNVGDSLYIKGQSIHYVGSNNLALILRSMIHVPGIRGNPERIYKPAATDGNAFAGLFENYVVSIIDRFQKKEPEKLAQLQSHLQKLGLTDTIQIQRLNETQLELRVGRILGNSTDTVNIADVGFGVSQVLPVVVALLVAEPGQLVYIEQPEIHLHPRAQVALAEIFAEAINRGVQVIVETHSELFLLSIQALVAEDKIASDDVKLHWFTRSADGSSTVTTAELDETGAFGDWPQDFGSTSLELTHRYLSSAEKKLWKSVNHD